MPNCIFSLNLGMLPVTHNYLNKCFVLISEMCGLIMLTRSGVFECFPASVTFCLFTGVYPLPECVCFFYLFIFWHACRIYFLVTNEEVIASVSVWG